MKENIICIECESEFKVKELYSELVMQFCPYCGEELDYSEDDE